MEELFVGNSIILLFWVYISFIIEVEEKSKKVMLMYLITYITNVLNIVPTIQSYGILLLALFLEMEFWEDKFKKQIINNFFENSLLSNLDEIRGISLLKKHRFLVMMDLFSLD